MHVSEIKFYCSPKHDSCSGKQWGEKVFYMFQLLFSSKTNQENTEDCSILESWMSHLIAENSCLESWMNHLTVGNSILASLMSHVWNSTLESWKNHQLLGTVFCLPLPSLFLLCLGETKVCAKHASFCIFAKNNFFFL